MWAKLGRLLPYILLYITAVAIVGLFNILTVDYRDEILRSAEFWNRVISQNIANLLILIATTSMYLEKHKETDKDLLELEAVVKKAVLQDLDGEFGIWVFNKNKQEKIETYRSIIQRKINRDEIKANIKDLDIWYYGTNEEKKSNRYCRRRSSLEDLIRPERLEKYILALKVNYDEIDRSFIETGAQLKTPKKNAKQDTVVRKIKDNYVRFLFTIGGAAFFNAFVYSADLLDAAFWFQLSYSLVLLLVMFLSGKDYARDYVRKVLIVDLNTRYNIIKDYLTHKVNDIKEGKENA
jgi:hypothetical protein